MDILVALILAGQLTPQQADYVWSQVQYLQEQPYHPSQQAVMLATYIESAKKVFPEA